MKPFPVQRAWIPSVIAAVVIVGFLAMNRRGPILGGAFAGLSSAPTGPVATTTSPTDDAAPQSGANVSVPRPALDAAPTASAVPVGVSAAAPVSLVVDVRPSRTSRGASDVYIGSQFVGTLDRLGRTPCLYELTRLARVASKSAESQRAELRTSLKTASGTNQSDASDVLAAITAAGVRGVSLDGATLFRGVTGGR